MVILIVLTSWSLIPLVQCGYWKMVFNDEFNSLQINKGNWNVANNNEYVNDLELQYYQAKNSRIENGALVLEAKKEKSNNKDFTSGKVTSTKSWTYGKFEMRAKLPRGDFLWPAFWMMPLDSVYGRWPSSGEMDIMEARGQQPTRLEGTLHYGKSDKEKERGAKWTGNVDFKTDFTRDFHIYGYQWDATAIRWFIDGREYYNVSMNQNFYPSFYKAKGQPFDQKFFMIFNVAVGGPFFGDNYKFSPEDADKWQRPKLEIDWLRVYQWQN